MIVAFSRLEKLREIRTVYTAGSFDLLHKGHVDYLRSIKTQFPKHKLVLGVLPDKRVMAKKGQGRPVTKQNDRLAVVDSIKYVDYAFICPIYEHGQDATFVVLEKLRPEFVVFPDRKYEALRKSFEAIHSKLIVQQRIGNKSTTQIIKRIRQSIG